MTLEKAILEDYILSERIDLTGEKYLGFIHEDEHYIFDAKDQTKYS